MPTQHLQAAFGDPAQQFVAASQAQVLSQIRQDQPAFALRAEVFTQA